MSTALPASTDLKKTGQDMGHLMRAPRRRTHGLCSKITKFAGLSKKRGKESRKGRRSLNFKAIILHCMDLGTK